MGGGVWNIVTFTINGFAFMLIGLQLPTIAAGLSAYPTRRAHRLGVAISLTVIVARIVWVFPATYLPRMAVGARSAPATRHPPPGAVVRRLVGGHARRRVAGGGARPAADPKPFPERDLVIFLTFCVIVATLVGQGLTLPWLVRRLGVVATDGPTTRGGAGSAGGGRGGAPAGWPTSRASIRTTRSSSTSSARATSTRPSHVCAGRRGTARTRRSTSCSTTWRSATRCSIAEREAVIGLRDDGIIGDEVLHRVERDLDLEVAPIRGVRPPSQPRMLG